MVEDPLDGDALVLAAAKSSVSGERLPDLVDRAQEVLAARLPEYGRRYECVHEDETAAVFFVEEGHWANIGEELDLGEREWKALRRAHGEHLKRLGRELGRRQEFVAALELRETVAVGKT
jgi:hypothetical protein